MRWGPRPSRTETLCPRSSFLQRTRASRESTDRTLHVPSVPQARLSWMKQHKMSLWHMFPKEVRLIFTFSNEVFITVCFSSQGLVKATEKLLPLSLVGGLYSEALCSIDLLGCVKTCSGMTPWCESVLRKRLVFSSRVWRQAPHLSHMTTAPITSSTGSFNAHFCFSPDSRGLCSLPLSRQPDWTLQQVPIATEGLPHSVCQSTEINVIAIFLSAESQWSPMAAWYYNLYILTVMWKDCHSYSRAILTCVCVSYPPLVSIPPN